jgi:hypothetical protein
VTVSERDCGIGFSAPRLPRSLVAVIARLDDRSMPIAEINRRVGAEAERRGLQRPSYERVRTLVHELRRRRSQPGTAEVLWDISTRVRHPEEVLDHISGIGVRKL